MSGYIRVDEYPGEAACDVCNEQHQMYVPAYTKIVHHDKISRVIGYRCRAHPYEGPSA